MKKIIDWLIILAFPVYAGMFLSPTTFIGICLAMVSFDWFMNNDIYTPLT